ncbi:MAG: AraC family transcriptional regulator, partial [Algoriphagus sp.]
SYIHPTPEKDKMGDILDYILKNFKEKITLQEVSSMANMSESSFSRYFKSRVNKSFSDFLGDVRISNARKLLQDEDLNISQVCFESGFPTLSNFNKQFKDRIGKTPLNYKKEYNEHF